MATNHTMHDYLYWRGDLSFEQDPFNEVDNLILSQLAYVDFDEIVSDQREVKIGIGEVCKTYWEMHTEEEIRNRKSFVKLAPFLLKPVAQSRRFREMKLSGYVNYVSNSEQAQMSAIQYELEDGTVYVAFRGTDETLAGWREDFNLSFMPRTVGQRLAMEYLKSNFQDTNLRLRVGGHSKGGNFAVYAAAFAGPEVDRQIEQVITNDGPGFCQEVTETPEYKKVLTKTISIIPGNSVIGLLLDSDLEPLVVRSSASGIMQHDALTWQVKANRFVRTERTVDSLFVEKMMTDWLGRVDVESRRVIVDQIFNVLQSTGAHTMKDVRSSSLKEVKEAIQMARSLPKEEQKEVTQALRQLVKSYERTFYEELENSQDANIPDFIKKWAAKRSDAIEKEEADALQDALQDSVESAQPQAVQMEPGV